MAEATGKPGVRAGAIGQQDGSVLWRVWAPLASRMTLVLIDEENRSEIPMDREPRGFHCVLQHGVNDGQRYRYRFDDGHDLADPCFALAARGRLRSIRSGFSRSLSMDRHELERRQAGRSGVL